MYMRHILALLAFVCCMLPSGLSCRHLTQDDFVNVPYDSFILLKGVIILNKTCEGCENVTILSSSGVLVHKSTNVPGLGFVLTARHFCNETTTSLNAVGHVFYAFDVHGNQRRAWLRALSEEGDACLLSVNDVPTTVQPARLSDVPLKRGQVIYNIAAPGGFYAPEMVPTFMGVYSGMLRDTHVFTLPIAPGSSGSGVFDSRGDLVSILSSIPTHDKEGTQPILESLSKGVSRRVISDLVEAARKLDDVPYEQP